MVKKKKALFVTFLDFCSINVSMKATFKIPMWYQPPSKIPENLTNLALVS